MNDRQRKILALAVTVFMAVAYVALVTTFVFEAHRYAEGAIPLGAMMLLVITPIITYVLFDLITRTTIRAIFSQTKEKELDIDGKDPLMAWMAIIFDKED